MITENGKIIEATENELFAVYLKRDMDLIMDFPTYMEKMKKEGCTVVEEGE